MDTVSILPRSACDVCLFLCLILSTILTHLKLSFVVMMVGKREFVHNELFLILQQNVQYSFIYREGSYVCIDESSDADLSYV